MCELVQVLTSIPFMRPVPKQVPRPLGFKLLMTLSNTSRLLSVTFAMGLSTLAWPKASKLVMPIWVPFMTSYLIHRMEDCFTRSILVGFRLSAILPDLSRTKTNLPPSAGDRISNFVSDRVFSFSCQKTETLWRNIRVTTLALKIIRSIFLMLTFWKQVWQQTV